MATLIFLVSISPWNLHALVLSGWHYNMAESKGTKTLETWVQNSFTHCHFHHNLLVKASHKVSLDSRAGKQIPPLDDRCSGATLQRSMGGCWNQFTLWGKSFLQEAPYQISSDFILTHNQQQINSGYLWLKLRLCWYSSSALWTRKRKIVINLENVWHISKRDRTQTQRDSWCFSPCFQLSLRFINGETPYL